MESFDPVRLLPGGYSLYVSLRGDTARELLGPLVNPEGDRSLDRYLRKIRRVYGTMTATDSGGTEWSLVIPGEYSDGLLRWGLRLHSGWTRDPGGGAWWCDSQGIQMAPVSSRLLLVSTGGMKTLMANYRASSSGAAGGVQGPSANTVEELGQADLVLLGDRWPGQFLPGDLNIRKDALTRWTVFLNRQEDRGYAGRMYLDFREERQARGAAATLKLLGIREAPGENSRGIRFAGLKIERSGLRVNIENLQFSELELNSLLAGGGEGEGALLPGALPAGTEGAETSSGAR